MEKYDSSKDTNLHIRNINNVMKTLIVPMILERATIHDASKLEPGEKETYDKYIPLLRTAKYGTPEYNKIRDDMAKEGLSLHYKNNRHHPEHFKNMVNDMNIIDFVEMLCDWFAASLKSDTSFMNGLQTNVDKYNLPDMIVKIIENTYNDIFKNYELGYKGSMFKSNQYCTQLSMRITELHAKGILTDEYTAKILSTLSDGIQPLE